MAAERNDSLHDWDDKVWDPAFARDRIPIESRPYIETIRSIGRKGSTIHILFNEHEKFCGGVSVNDLMSGIALVENSPIAWLDDRKYSCEVPSGITRSKKCALTATELYEALKIPVCIRHACITTS